MPEKIKVLSLAPLHTPQTVEIDNTLQALQQAVGGNIEVIRPWGWEENAAIIADEDGKLKNYPPNRMLGDNDLLVGTFLVCGVDEDEFCSLTQEQIQKYEEMYHYPEVFLPATQGGVLVFKAGSDEKPRHVR